MTETTTRARCWVLRDPEGGAWDDEHDAHFDTAVDAQSEIDELLEDREDDELERARALSATELPAPCLILTCSSCGEEPEGEEFAHIHFPDVASLDTFAEMCDWRRVDGQWRCFDCPTMDDEDEEDEGPMPGPDDVPLFLMPRSAAS